MPTVYRQKNGGAYDSFAGINNQINAIGEKQLLKQQEKKLLDQALQKLILEYALKNKQLKQGADLSGINTSGGVQGLLGQLNPMLEQAKAIPQTSISISERPYSDMQKAREVLQRSPADYGKAGMAKKTGGWFGWGPGSKWEMSPEAQDEQSGAKTVLGNPYRTTKRISYKGGAIDTEGTDVTNELPDPSAYDEGTIIEDDNGKQYKLESGEWVIQ